MPASTRLVTAPAVNRAPVFTPIDPKQVLENQLLTSTVSATDPDGDGIVLSATNLPTGASFNAQTGAFSWTPTLSQAGNYLVTFNATDNGTPVEIGHIDEKVEIFIEHGGQGQIQTAINQLNAFISKVNTDYNAGTITQGVRDNLVGLAEDLLTDLQ